MQEFTKQNGKRVRTGSAEREGGRILPFRREARLNIALIVFAFIAIYLIFSLVRSATRKQYASFEVGREESLSDSRTYQALILRQEQVVNSRWAGYVDIFASEASHVSVGSIVSSVDEIGTYSESIRESAGMQHLSDEELMRLKGTLRGLSASYRDGDFSSVYDVKDSIDAFFIAYLGNASLDVLEQNASLNEFFHVHKSDTSGLVLYYQDGYEARTADSLRESDFSGSGYKRSATAGLVAAGDFLYKLVDSENWSLLFPVTPKEAAIYGNEDTLRFTFLKNGLNASADCSIINGADGSLLVKLDMSRYLVQYASDRFTEIRIESVGERGYKIPASCRTEENVFLIPLAYEIVAGEEPTGQFLKETYSSSTRTIETVSLNVYRRDDTYCYVSGENLTSEDVLLKPDSQERYTVRLSTSLTGVYQINSGYTVFCPIEILEESEDYFLVKKGTYKGISTYDILLLDAADYKVGQVLR